MTEVELKMFAVTTCPKCGIALRSELPVFDEGDTVRAVMDGLQERIEGHVLWHRESNSF